MTPLSRRRFLAATVATATVVAGCSGDGDSAADPTGTGTPGPAAVEVPGTAAAGDSIGTATGTAQPAPDVDCEAAARPDPEGSADDVVDPAAYPDPPAGEADVDWATSHEQAYLRNLFVRDEDVTSWEGVTMADSRVEEHPHGVVVWISLTYAVGTDGEDPIQSPVQTAGYYVDDRGARRVGVSGELPANPDLDPAVDGAPVVCF